MMAGTADSGEPRSEDLGPAEAGPAQPAVVRAVIVDDHPDIRELLHLQLDRAPGISVVGVGSDGLEAIALAEEHQPDVLVLDLGLPRLSGIDALPRLREISPRTKVVALSGFEESSQAKEAREAGVDAYVEKGLSMDIAEVIRDVVRDPR